MSQILGYRSPAGIAIAVDSRAVSYPAETEAHYQSIQKLFVLTPYVVILTAGAGYGILASGKFQVHVSRHPWWGFKEIRGQALPFLRAEIDRFGREGGKLPSQTELDRVYFVLAGFVPQHPADPFHLELLGAEHGSELLHAIQTGPVVAVPRRMGIEYRLSNLHATGKGLDEAEQLCENCLFKLAEQTGEVGPPFHFVRITAGGITVRTRRESV